jgi:hypothetical protein
MIESGSGSEAMKELCAAVFLEDQKTEREKVTEKLEDCLDLIAAVQSVNEIKDTGDISDWDEFEKELDAME